MEESPAEESRCLSMRDGSQLQEKYEVPCKCTGTKRRVVYYEQQKVSYIQYMCFSVSKGSLKKIHHISAQRYICGEHWIQFITDIKGKTILS